MADHTDLTTALDAIASLARIPAARIIQYLVAHPQSFYGQIQEATDIPPASVTRYLQSLETAGVIAGDIPVETRRGRSVRYTVRADRITSALDLLRRELLEEGE